MGERWVAVSDPLFCIDVERGRDIRNLASASIGRKANQSKSTKAAHEEGLGNFETSDSLEMREVATVISPLGFEGVG